MTMEEIGATQPHVPAVAVSNGKKKPFYTSLSWQVLFGIAVGIVFGIVKPATAVAMKPLGDGFIRLITMIIAVIIFCTVVTGIAGMEDMKKVGPIMPARRKRKACPILFCTSSPTRLWTPSRAGTFCKFFWSRFCLASRYPRWDRAASMSSIYLTA